MVDGMPTFLVILNYIVRAMVAVVGVIIFFLPIPAVDTDTTMFKTMGVVFMLFGVYRVASFYNQQNQLRREQFFAERRQSPDTDE
jgi:hypothetical protein